MGGAGGVGGAGASAGEGAPPQRASPIFMQRQPQSPASSAYQLPGLDGKGPAGATSGLAESLAMSLATGIAATPAASEVAAAGREAEKAVPSKLAATSASAAETPLEKATRMAEAERARERAREREAEAARRAEETARKAAVEAKARATAEARARAEIETRAAEAELAVIQKKAAKVAAEAQEAQRRATEQQQKRDQLRRDEDELTRASGGTAPARRTLPSVADLVRLPGNSGERGVEKRADGRAVGAEGTRPMGKLTTGSQEAKQSEGATKARLKRAHEEMERLSKSADGTAELLELLHTLSAEKVTVALLESTSVGRAVSKVAKSHMDEHVARMAAEVRDRWKASVAAERERMSKTAQAEAAVKEREAEQARAKEARIAEARADAARARAEREKGQAKGQAKGHATQKQSAATGREGAASSRRATPPLPRAAGADASGKAKKKTAPRNVGEHGSEPRVAKRAADAVDSSSDSNEYEGEGAAAAEAKVARHKRKRMEQVASASSAGGQQADAVDDSRLRVGQKVRARYKATRLGEKPTFWFLGVIIKVRDGGAYDVHYADGDEERGVHP